MPLIGDLTRPENAAELRERRRLLRLIEDKGGCVLCQNRDREVIAWGRSVCRQAGRKWPGCAQDGREPRFVLDEVQLGAMR